MWNVEPFTGSPQNSEVVRLQGLQSSAHGARKEGNIMPMRPADTRCVRDSQKVFSDLNEHVGAGNILGIRYTAAGGQYPALSIVPDVCSGSLGDVVDQQHLCTEVSSTLFQPPNNEQGLADFEPQGTRLSRCESRFITGTGGHDFPR